METWLDKEVDLPPNRSGEEPGPQFLLAGYAIESLHKRTKTSLAMQASRRPFTRTYTVEYK